MKRIHLYTLLLFSIVFPSVLSAQQEEEKDILKYKAEFFSSLSSSSTTPFWMVSNRYGKVPLNNNNAYLSAGIFQNQHFGNGFYWTAGMEAIATTSRYRNVFIQQLYGEIGYKNVLLSIGSKEKYTSLWDRNLSSGDIVFSNNARPIPEINFSIPKFLAIPYTRGWLHFKGDFAFGRSFDTKYLEQFVTDNSVYVKDVLWHHKSLHLKMEDTENNFPFSMAIGVQHWAQWGGTSSNPRIGKQPSSFKDMIRIIVFHEGGADATASDQINVLGNHYGSYDFKFSYKQENWNASFYHQRFFDDKSGVEFANRWDGLWGLEIGLKQTPWLRKIVAEIVDTRYQSGSFHFIAFDREKYPGRGGGADNYYNNGEYITGVSYFNRSLASPLLPSPEYNQDGSLGFKCNRVKDYHIGLEGDITSLLSYRVLFTVMANWGTHEKPYLKKKAGTSSLIDLAYTHPRLTDWKFKGSVALDSGSVFDNGIGFSFSVVKQGMLKNW